MSGRKLSLLQLLVLIAALIGLGWHAGSLHAQQPTPPAASPPAGPPASSESPPTTEGVAKQPPAQPPEARAPDAAAKSVPPGEGIPALVVDVDQMQGVLGKPVRSAAGEDMGRIVDVIIDKSARVRAAVIDFGGFLGVGSRQIAVAWNAIRVAEQQGKPRNLVLDFTRDQLRVAPAYKANEQVVLLGPTENPPPASPPPASAQPAPPAPAAATPANGTTEKDASKDQPSK